MEKTFFEYISMADSEKVHSQTIGWIFSDNCKAISKIEKERVIQNLISSKNQINIEEVFVEIDDIDILIKCGKELVVIENKIKISQHDNQLKRYKLDAEIKASELGIKPEKIFYLYLTLDKESAKERPWIDISYFDLITELGKCNKLENNDSVILEQYLKTITRILDTINHSILDNELRKWCFKNTTIKKYDLLKQSKFDEFNNSFKEKKNKDNALYLIETGMIRLIQKIFYKRTLESINQFFLEANFSSTEFGASSSNGEGLIQLNFKKLSFRFNGINFNVGYQIQNQTIKINISHEEYSNSKKEELPVYFRGLLETIKKELEFNGRLSIGVTKAYGSITKKIPHNIPELMTPEKLAHYIEEDIKTSNYHKIIESVLLSKLNDENFLNK